MRQRGWELILRASDSPQGQPRQQSQGCDFRDAVALQQVSSDLKSEWHFRWLGRAWRGMHTAWSPRSQHLHNCTPVTHGNLLVVASTPCLAYTSLPTRCCHRAPLLIAWHVSEVRGWGPGGQARVCLPRLMLPWPFLISFFLCFETMLVI